MLIIDPKSTFTLTASVHRYAAIAGRTASECGWQLGIDEHFMKSIQNQHKNKLPMCLHTKQIMPIKAKTNIVCFKVLIKHKHKTGWKKYQTPIMRVPVKMYIEMYANGNNNLPYGPFNTVSDSFIHAFTTMEKAQEWAKSHVESGVIARCIIPKNTLYYISKDRDQICAKCMKPIRIYR